MRNALNLPFIVLVGVFAMACGASDDDDQPPMDDQPEVVELGIDHYMEPCRVPFTTWCHRVDTGSGFEVTHHCVEGLDDYRWGTRYRVRAELRQVDHGGLTDARCDQVYTVLETLSTEEASADTAFTLPGMDAGFLDNLEGPDPVTLAELPTSGDAISVALMTSQTALISRLNGNTFDLSVRHGAEGAGLVSPEVIRIHNGCEDGNLALGTAIICGDPCYCPEFQPEQEGPACDAQGAIVCDNERFGPNGGIIFDCADWDPEAGFPDCSQ